MEITPRIRSIVRTATDAVMVFDVNGEQIQKYQGSYHKVREIVCREAPDDARFAHWYGQAALPVDVPRRLW